MTRRQTLARQTPDDTVTLTIPRAALTIVEAPRTVSQRTAERVLGIPTSHYLGSLRAYAAAGGQVFALGRLRIVEVDDYVTWLRRSGRSTPTTTTPAEQPRDDVDDLAAELGLQVRAG